MEINRPFIKRQLIVCDEVDANTRQVYLMENNI